MVELITQNAQELITFTPEHEKLLARVCEAVMEEEECDFDAQISLTLTDNESIRRLNGKFRKIDSATDVLSFPMLEFDADGNIEDNEYEADDGKIMLGDIVISLERAKEQAAEFGHSFEREIAFLTAHSMLHLLGYDHVDNEEGDRIMRAKQKKVLDGIGLTRMGEE